MASVLDYDTTPGNNSTINSINIAEGNAPATINNAIREQLADIAKWVHATTGEKASTGTADAQAVTTALGWSALEKMMIAFEAGAGLTNTGAMTLDVDGFGAVSVKLVNGNDPAAGAVTAGGIYLVAYDGAVWQLLNPTPAGIGNIVEDTTPQLGGDLDLNGFNIDFPTTANISDVLDEDNMASNSATALATQQSIKAYADLMVPLAGGTMSGELIMADNLVTRPLLKDYGEEVSALGSGGGTRTFNIANGNVFTVTVSTSTNTFVFSNPTASGDCCSLTLIITNGGSQTVNWPASVDWQGGNAPTLTASGVDVLTFLTTDGGTTWYGFPAGLDMG